MNCCKSAALMTAWDAADAGGCQAHGRENGAGALRHPGCCGLLPQVGDSFTVLGRATYGTDVTVLPCMHNVDLAAKSA